MQEIIQYSEAAALPLAPGAGKDTEHPDSDSSSDSSSNDTTSNDENKSPEAGGADISVDDTTLAAGNMAPPVDDPVAVVGDLTQPVDDMMSGAKLTPVLINDPMDIDPVDLMVQLRSANRRIDRLDECLAKTEAKNASLEVEVEELSKKVYRLKKKVRALQD